MVTSGRNEPELFASLLIVATVGDTQASCNRKTGGNLTNESESFEILLIVAVRDRLEVRHLHERIHQNLTGKLLLSADLATLRHDSGQVPTGRVAHDDNLVRVHAVLLLGNGQEVFDGPLAVQKTSRKRSFRGETVVDRDDYRVESGK